MKVILILPKKELKVLISNKVIRGILYNEVYGKQKQAIKRVGADYSKIHR